jgi:hypothetical protein
MGKIFGIGLPKTGTTSLHLALQTLGYKAVHYPNTIAAIEAHEAVTDIQAAVAFKLWDVMYPGSKFILTVRDRDSWLLSCARHFQRAITDQFALNLRKAVFGMTGFNDSWFYSVYNNHEQSVLDYFRGRDNELLVMAICGGDGWEKLCPFLDKPIPAIAFPHENRSP